ncbi:hypothetical protein OAA06_01415 [bacterium]|nr:hypothetical protein [bacterium]
MSTLSKKLKYTLLIAFLLINTFAFAQEEEEEHHHHCHKYELGVANAIAITPEEGEAAYALHLHIIRHFEHTKFGVGLGYEKVFDEHKHNSIGVVGTYNPIGKLNFSLSPGIAYEGSGFEETKFVVHLETSYDFMIGNFHAGPAIEYSYNPEHSHYSFGLHIGIGI